MQDSIQDDVKTAPGPVGSKRRSISMSVINFLLDAALLLLLTLYGWEIAMLRIVFPAPSSSAGWSLWGWNFDQWWDFQFGTLCAFAVAVMVHLMLHWNWVCTVLTSQILKRKGRPNNAVQTILGVATLVVLLHLIAFGVIAALASVNRPAA